MKTKYAKAKESSRTFNLLGFVFAVILTVGLLDKAGVSIGFKGDDAFKLSETSVAAGTLQATDTETSEVIQLNMAEEPVDDQPYVKAGFAVTAPKVTPVSKAEAWIDHFSGLAANEAVERGVPAGLSLAVAINKMQEGATIKSQEDFVEKVVIPLAKIKYQASPQYRSDYFKYTANSERWVEGLGKTGQYSESALHKIMQQYGLSTYDQLVKSKLVKSRDVDPEVESTASYVADEIKGSFRGKNAPAEDFAEYAETTKAFRSAEEKVTAWENDYEEMVGREVAKEIAKKKLKDRKYLSEEDMAGLIEETNVQTVEVIENNLAFPGRKINRKHKDAGKLVDITDPKNSQAREELYQQKLRERRNRD